MEGIYTVKEAALRLHLGERRIMQLKKEFRLHGEGAALHRNAGKHPANYTDETLRGTIVSLKQRTAYEQTNFTHFRELLEEREAIKVGYATLSRILKGRYSVKTEIPGERETVLPAHKAQSLRRTPASRCDQL